MTVANELHPLLKKRLTEIVQLLQTYARLAELEINAGERPRAGDVALPEDTGERIRAWTGGEEAEEKARQKLVGELVPAMEAWGYDTGAVKAVLGG